MNNTTGQTPCIANTASGAADKVLAYLDDLSDDAAAHIFPSDLAKCMTSECVVEVVSVRAGNPNERTVPLFSREQVVAALASTPAQPVAEPAPSATAHVGDSLFESWFSEYNPAHRGTKQQMRDAYAAGMGDPKAHPSPTPQASHGQALRLLTQKEKDSLGRRAEGMDGNECDQWVQEKFAQVNGLKVQGGSYERDWE